MPARPPDVFALMERHAVVGRAPPEALSHTSMSKGKYIVSSLKHAELMAAWGAAVDAGRKLPALVERHRHIGPVVIDIDLRQPASAPNRIYIDADVAALVAALRLELGRLVDLGGEGVDARCFVLEKPAPRPCKGGATFKDGLHLELPMVVTRAELQVRGLAPLGPPPACPPARLPVEARSPWKSVEAHGRGFK